MSKQRNQTQIGFLNLAVLAVTSMAAFYAGQKCGSMSATVTAVVGGLGVAVAIVSFLQIRHERAEQLEEMELDQLKGKDPGGQLFGEGGEDLRRARRAREQFEKYFVPCWTIGIMLFEVFIAYQAWVSTERVRAPQKDLALVTAAFFGLFGLIQFMFGKYSVGVARYEGTRLLRPAGSLLMIVALASVMTAVANVANWLGFPKFDKISGAIMAACIGLLALENAINLLMEIYRPRVSGRRSRLLYESRLVGIFGQPGGIFSTAAHALDYQFGFKVSETWFYRYLDHAVGWLVLLWTTVFLGSSCIIILEPSEEALLERFGKPVLSREVLGPGMHFKLPWPIDRVHRYSTRAVQTFTIGFDERGGGHDDHAEEASEEADDGHGHGHSHGEKSDGKKKKKNARETLGDDVHTWTASHDHEENLMLVASREVDNIQLEGGSERAVPVNLIQVHIPVQFEITNVVQWARNHLDAGTLLRRLADREVLNYLVSIDMNDIMTRSREKATTDLQSLIQASANQHRLGVRILFVGLWGIQPPTETAPDFEAVIGAMQERETKILKAQAYRSETLPMSRAEARKRVLEAKGGKVAKISNAIAQSGQFTNQIAAYLASPSVYKQRTYLATLVESMAGARKYILGTTNNNDSYWINLEDKFSTDLLDIKMSPKSKEISEEESK